MSYHKRNDKNKGEYLPVPTGAEVVRMIKEAGCKFASQGTYHEWWINPKTGERFQVPRHKTQEVKAKTLHSILKAAGIRK